MEDLMSILLVDDQPELLKNLSLALETAGYNTIMANDGIEALAALQSRHVDLILSDIKMPGMNGYQLYQGVRENPAWTTIPFLFLTAHGRDATINLDNQGQAISYLAKPIRVKQLLSVLRDTLQHH